MAIVCPAKKLPKSIDAAIAILEDWGLEVVVGETVTASYNQFAGDDHVMRGLQIKTAVLQIDKNVVEARGREGAWNLWGAVDLQAAAINGFAPLEAFTGGIGSHRYRSTISGWR